VDDTGSLPQVTNGSQTRGSDAKPAPPADLSCAPLAAHNHQPRRAAIPVTLVALPNSLQGLVSLCEISDGAFVATDLFQRKFGQPPPGDPHHLVALIRTPSGAFIPACYAHFRAFGDICLVGGGATDGRAFSSLTPGQGQSIRDAGGLFYFVLRFGFERFADRFYAFFGHCGDPRAEEVDLRAGFRHTPVDKLLIYTPKPLLEQVERALVAKAAALGPF